MIVIFTIFTGINIYFVYCNWSLIKNVSCIKFNTDKEKKIWMNIKMGETKQINIKNRTYYFYNGQINLKDFDTRLLKIDKKDYNEIDIYYIGYVTIKKIADYNNINIINPLYLMINELSATRLRKKIKMNI